MQIIVQKFTRVYRAIWPGVHPLSILLPVFKLPYVLFLIQILVKCPVPFKITIQESSLIPTAVFDGSVGSGSPTTRSFSLLGPIIIVVCAYTGGLMFYKISFVHAAVFVDEKPFPVILVIFKLPLVKSAVP